MCLSCDFRDRPATEPPPPHPPAAAMHTFRSEDWGESIHNTKLLISRKQRIPVHQYRQKNILTAKPNCRLREPSESWVLIPLPRRPTDSSTTTKSSNPAGNLGNSLLIDLPTVGTGREH